VQPLLAQSRKGSQNGPGTGLTDPIHIHLTAWLIQERDAGRPLPEEGSFKDPSLPRDNETVQVIGRYDGMVSPGRPIFERPCAFHRHNLEHETHARRSLFEVLWRGGGTDARAGDIYV
jgi:hypothetical protein